MTIYLQNVERVMILNCSRVDCNIKKTVFVVLLIFKYLLDVRHVRDLITRHDCSSQLFHQKLHLQNVERVATYDCSNQLYRQKDCVCRVIDFQIRFRCMI